MIARILSSIARWMIANQSHPKKRFGVYMFIICLAALATAVLFHFSLTVYYAFSLAVLILTIAFLYRYDIPERTVVDETKAICLFSLVTITVLSVITFETYCNAKGGVFANIDHHALSLKGFALADKGIIYGNDKTALVEDTLSGDIVSYELERNSQGKVTAIHFKSDNFGRTFFVKKKGENIAVNVNEALPIIKEEITFCNRNAEAESPYLKLTIREAKDSACYVFTAYNAERKEVSCEEAAFHGFIQKSYPLAELIPSSIAAKFKDGLSGYLITRNAYCREESKRESDFIPLGIKKLAKLTFRKHDFVLEQTGETSANVVLENIAAKHPLNATVASGDVFFVSFGIAGTQMLSIDEQGHLLYDLPISRPLPSEQDYSQVFVSTSDRQICLNKTAYNIFFPTHQYEGNKNLFSLNINFRKGLTTQPLSITINNDSIRGAGQDFLIETNRSPHRAILCLQDFKAMSSFSSSNFRWLFFLLFCLCTLCVCVNRQATDTRERYVPATELVCLILLLVFFTTRYLLCWRISVFPPLEEVSRFEFDVYQNKELISMIHWMFVAIMFMILFKYLMRKEFGQRFLTKPWHVCLCSIVLFIIEVVIGSSWSSAFGHIVIPIAAYFLIEILIARVKSIQEDDALQPGVFLLQRPYVINYLFHLALVAVFDAGFAVMFFFFGLLRFCLLLCQYIYLNTADNIKWLNVFNREKRDFARVILLFVSASSIVVIFLFLRFLPCLLGTAMDVRWVGLTLITLSIIVGLVLIGWLIFPLCDTHLFRRLKIGIQNGFFVVCGLLSLSTFTAVPYIYDHTIGPDTKQIHIRYRTKVLVETWDNILNKEQMSDAKHIARFRQTSENQWILDHYYMNRSKDSDSYFKLLPLNKTGAMWGAQATDISFLRFGIAEHGSTYALLIFFLLLAVMVFVMRQPRNIDDKKQIAFYNVAVGAILLLVVQSVFVWMSVTNRFIFFGQDFPMLSITSKSSMFYFVILIFVAILLMPPVEEDHDSMRANIFKGIQKKIAWGVSIVLFLFCLSVYFIVGRDRENKEKSSYNLQLLQAERVLRQHNIMLHYYQLHENSHLMKQANRYIVGSNSGRNRYAQDLFLQFNNDVYRNIEADDETVSNDCIVQLGDSAENKFPLVGNQLSLHDAFVAFSKKQKGDIGLAYGKDSITVSFTLANTDSYAPAELRLFREINRLFTIYQIENAGLRNANLAVFNRRDIGKEATQMAHEIRKKLEDVNLTEFMQSYQTFLKTHGQDSIVRVCQDSLRRIPGAIFAKSLIAAYTTELSKNNDPDGLIYLCRNRLTHYLEFVVNKEYFDIPELNKDGWKGNIVADKSDGNEELMVREDKIYQGRAEHNSHFSLVKIPSSWLPNQYSSEEQYAIRSFSPIRLMLNGLQSLSVPYHGYTSLRLSGYDVMSITEAHNVPKAFLPNRDSHIFVHNIWFNGHRRMVYPLDTKMFWLYPYSQYVSEVMKDSGQAVSAKNYYTTLDYTLSEQLYDILDRAHKKADYELGKIVRKHSRHGIPQEELTHKFSVFVGNSEGHVVAMPDFKANPSMRMSPNDVAGLSAIRKRIRLFADYSDERSLYSNYNLQPLPFGPGSSLKPLTFSAVAAVFNNKWNKFSLVGTFSEKEPYIVWGYAGKQFGNDDYFASIKSDEPSFGSHYAVSDYLRRSSNFFNSAIVFMGSFSKQSLQEGIFEHVSRPTVKDFPIMANNNTLVKFKRIPDPRGLDKEPIMKQVFHDNYGIYAEPMLMTAGYKDQNTLEFQLRQGVYGRHPKGKRMSGENWIVPEPSYLDFPQWADPQQLSYAQRIKTLTLGMRKIVNITPFKMAEMYARLFLLDRNFHFGTSNKPYSSMVSFDAPAYASTAEYLKMLQGKNSLFSGMRQCAMPGGTASYLNEVCQAWNADHKDSIYLYAKTGTINDSGLDRKMPVSLNCALLAVIITNTDMTKVQINKNGQLTANGKPVKFYVVYIFMDKFCKDMSEIKKDIQKEIVKTVCESNHFKKFMKQ